MSALGDAWDAYERAALTHAEDVAAAVGLAQAEALTRLADAVEQIAARAPVKAPQNRAAGSVGDAIDRPNRAARHVDLGCR